MFYHLLKKQPDFENVFFSFVIFLDKNVHNLFNEFLKAYK